MVNDFQRRRNCYHESGHAVAWVINGDAIVKVVEDSTVSPQWPRSAGEAGAG